MNINQSKQCLSYKLLPNCLIHSFIASVSFFTLINQCGMVSANTEIMIDPYNDSGSGTMPIKSQSINTNFPSNTNNNQSFPTQNQNYTMGEIFVNGNPTPNPPSVVSGNLIKSNQTLPNIPPLSQPYSKQNDNFAIDNDNNNMPSTNFSPLDEIPNNVEEKKLINSSNNVNNTPRNINLTPLEINNNPNSETIHSVNKRRSLNDILVFSTPQENNSQNSKIIPSNPITSPTISSLTTKTNNIYKVLVKVDNKNQESQVESLYPEAFFTNFQGTRMLQVGVFSFSEKAEEVSQSLKNNGLNVRIIN